tara:strand:- start:1204 stop:2043 length:840 start_codon:yes stop_codon:yes gene_type:complete
MKIPQISVLMAVYNGEEFIQSAIESILNQSFKDFEFLIINDGSLDASLKIIKKYKAQDSRIILINREKRGLISCLNEGILLSRGAYIARMDADDIAIPERLSIQFNYLHKNPSVDLVGSNIIFFTDNMVKGISELEINKINNLNFYTNTLGLPHPTWMGRANFFKNFRYNRRAISVEDQDLLLRAYNSCKFILLEKPLLFYRIYEKINYKYKLNQLRFLFLSRLRNILCRKLFHYFPIILFVFIVSYVFCFFGVKNYNMKTTSNSKYQALFNKIARSIQ